MQKTMKLEVDRKVLSHIDGYRCVNCGKCEEYCPVNAISERQKEVCHLCPDCTEMKALTVDEMYDLRKESCTLECPLGISPQGYLNLVKAGKQKEAFDLIYDKNPLPSVCGYICHHPCEQICKRGQLVDEPMHIRAVKRYLGEKYLDEAPASYPVMNDLQIAVVGGGPAGLTAAHTLAKRGYNVTVFEQAAEAGGMLLKGIPNFRIDKAVVRKEIAKLEKAGIRFEFGVTVATQKEIDALKKDYDAVIIATGTQVSKGLPIEGSRIENILLAVNLMDTVNAGIRVPMYGDAVIIGGGSVAADVARTALRLGAETATMICLESGSQIPAHPWELQEALDEGVKLISGAAPLRYIGHTSKLEGLTFAKIENLDLSNFSYDIVEGSEETIHADFAIVATGQKSQYQFDREGVYFAGDIAGGKCSVIDAMASGRKIALAVDKDLTGRDYAEYEVEREIGLGERKYKVYPAVRMKADFPGIRELPAACRTGSFAVVEQAFTDDEVLLEVQRCLNCGYRFVDTEKCIGCGVCQKVCPKGDVITLEPEKEEN
ncbi:MAG: FAD-dependent oxidoreductase [Mogibacterium sp.]|nr:FAD-dependent oxidoreductase [Mogibacterium sp.]